MTDERDDVLRGHLQKLLDWEDAHASFDSAIRGIPTEMQGVAPEGLPHSPWQILEHIRQLVPGSLRARFHSLTEERRFDSSP